MSKSKESGEVRRNVIAELNSELSAVQLAIVKEKTGIYKGMYRIGAVDSDVTIRFHLSASAKLQRRSGYDYYWVGLPGSIKTETWVLLVCGYAGGKPERLYWIPTPYVTGEETEEFVPYYEGEYDRFQLHIEIHDDGRQLIKGGKGTVMDISGNSYPSVHELVAEFILDEFRIMGYEMPAEDKKQLEREASDDCTEIGGRSQEQADREIPQYIDEYRRMVDSLKKRYSNECQIGGCGFTFRKRSRGFYSEGHHLVWRAKGGGPEASNVVILCPNHHRMLHYANVEIGELQGNKREVRINGASHFIVY